MNLKDAETEMEAYRDVVVLVKEIHRNLHDAPVFFHMVSSAGGLFEGQCNVTSDTPPQPVRPYGILKWGQEKYASNLCGSGLNVLIYRPSSVYGYIGKDGRLGLVPTLIHNGRHMKVSYIFGSIDTLRDYVLASDIGIFIADSILEPDSGFRLFTLASGKPSTIFEILRSVEGLLRRKLYLQFNATDRNSAHNSYSRSILPGAWKPTDLQTGIRRTYCDFLERATLMQRN